MRFSTLAVAGFTFLAASAFGQTTHTWTGLVNNQWGTAGNWNTNLVPVTGDSLVIASGATTTINNLVGVSLQSVTMAPNTAATIFQGSPIVLLSGGTIVDSAGFDVDYLSTGVTLNGPATITANSGNALIIDTPITGTGDVTFSTPGAIIFGSSVVHTYVGATTISGINYVHTYEGRFPTASPITLNSNLFIYGVSQSLGSLAGSGTLWSDGPVSVGSNNTTTTFSGIFKDDLGPAALLKMGTGTMTLSGANIYTGQTQVVSGRLNVNGTTVSPTVVESGATLGGTGTINNTVQVNSGGTLAPGVSPGTLTTGALTFNAGSTYAVELNGTAAGQFDRVVSTGAVNLGGATLAVSSSFTPALGTTFAIVQGLSVTGTFAAITAPPGLSLVAQYGSNSVTLLVAAAPSAPAIGTAVPGNGQATVSFTPGADNGSPITSFTATCGAFSASGPTSPITVPGLTNGTPYTCTVFATNAAGNGAASAASASVTPFTNPAAPSITSATPGNAQVTIVFTPPTANGSPILDYTANCGGTTATAATSPITVTGLANGTAYTCTVLARNAAGNGPASGPSASVTPFTIPGAPTITAVTPSVGSLAVAFSAAAPNGSAVTGYTANCGGITATGAASPLTVAGLVNGTPYTCTVFATNGAGNGPSSAPSAPTAPLINSFSAASATGSGTITASFTGGGAGCSYSVNQFIPVSGHAASPPNGSAPGATTFPHGLFDFRLIGCTPGSAITMTVTYPTALPAGTVYWKYGPTPSNTAPHWYTLPATIAGSTATFTITDGQQGDDDLVANGVIVDQGGPGVPGAPGTVTAVPTLSEWMLMLLALVMLVSAGVQRRASLRL
ncbi:beta strand repeat-containing protein [Usitatibacter palustris]|uniref:Fibronectin type-III domain-containing protein n=1 Tax=Usitatibacter palustris TaxID=2732487 RepID=A0A6M4H8Q4_9PROT|nr:IPTL-CTERM sorting domain-containing protein [Usitatibacter palustris]QJR15103.1 hypothetical protein DSM104440_01920 [Usitatibacter palustris]